MSSKLLKMYFRASFDFIPVSFSCSSVDCSREKEIGNKQIEKTATFSLTQCPSQLCSSNTKPFTYKQATQIILVKQKQVWAFDQSRAHSSSVRSLNTFHVPVLFATLEHVHSFENSHKAVTYPACQLNGGVDF